jgi:hypothetical protein
MELTLTVRGRKKFITISNARFAENTLKSTALKFNLCSSAEG